MTTLDTQSEAEAPEDSDSESESSFGAVGLTLLIGALGVLGWFSPWALVMVLAIVFIIFLHELAHFVTARRAGMKVTEFFIGFGPAIWSFQHGETRYGVKAIWAGAYVRVIGMNDIDEVDPEDEDRTYRSKSTGARVLMASAGSLMHFTLALVMFFALFVGYGIPSTESDEATWLVAAVTEGSAADLAGLQEGDKIIAINAVEVATWSELVDEIKAQPGEQVVLAIQRDGVVIQATTTLGERDGDGFLGVGPSMESFEPEQVGAIAAAREAVSTEASLMTASLDGIRTFFSPSNIKDFGSRVLAPPGADDSDLSPESRPVSIVGIVDYGAQGASQSAWNIVWLLAYFNVFIGVFNLLPVPPLDGGHIVVALYEAIRTRLSGQRYRVDTMRLVPIIYGVITVMVFFGLGAIYLDVSDAILGG